MVLKKSSSIGEGEVRDLGSRPGEGAGAPSRTVEKLPDLPRVVLLLAEWVWEQR